MARGDRRKEIFRDERGRWKFLGYLAEGGERFRGKVYRQPASNAVPTYRRQSTGVSQFVAQSANSIRVFPISSSPNSRSWRRMLAASKMSRITLSKSSFSFGVSSHLVRGSLSFTKSSASIFSLFGFICVRQGNFCECR